MSDLSISISGYCDLKLKKDWKIGYVCVVGGSLFYYKNQTDKDPKGHIDLNGYTVNNDVKPGDKKKFAFGIEKDGKAEFCAQFSTKEERDKWSIVISAGLTLEPCEAPSKEGVARKRKQTVGESMKKGIASSVADSGAGKVIMKKIINDETTALLNALKAIVTSESGNKKKADQLEEDIMKIAVKAVMLVDSKTVRGREFLAVDKPLRDALNLLSKIFNNKNKTTREKVVEALLKVETLMQEAQKILENILANHMGGKNMLRLAAIFQVVGDAKFMEVIMYKESVEPELEKLIDAIDFYTQFHWG